MLRLYQNWKNENSRAADRKGEKARSCFITKVADIKFYRQTWNSRVRGTSVFRLLFATRGPTTKTERFYCVNTREKQSSFAKERRGLISNSESNRFYRETYEDLPRKIKIFHLFFIIKLDSTCVNSISRKFQVASN